jgi:hypothetical protein
MKKKQTHRYAAAAAVLALLGLGWLGIKEMHGFTEKDAATGDEDRSGASSVLAGNDDDTPLKSKTSVRPPLEKEDTSSASEEQAEKFHRFFLPPITFQDVSLADALATLRQVYRDTAKATGEPALNLTFDLRSANKRDRITCTTPRSTVASVLHFIAAMAGNNTSGDLPSFRLIALDETRDKSGEMPLFAQFKSILPQNAGNGQPVNLSTLLHEGMAAAGIGDDSTEVRMIGTTLTYKNLNEADLEKLKAIAQMDEGGEIGQLQTKFSFQILRGNESILPAGNPDSMTAAEFQSQMQKLQGGGGGDFTQTGLPEMISRSDETAKMEMTHDLTDPNGQLIWTGTKAEVGGGPLGLGHQLTLNFESREIGEAPVVVQKEINISDGGSGIISARTANGQVILICPQVTFIDHQGRPVAARR